MTNKENIQRVNAEVSKPSVQNPASPNSGGEGLLDLLKRSAEASLVFAALLYVIGWSYLDGYYATFSLKVGQLGISNQEAALASFKFIFHSVPSTIVFCSGLVIIGMTVSYLYRRLGNLRELAVVSFYLGLLCISGLLWHEAFLFGRDTAWKDMLTESTTLPRVEVEVDDTRSPLKIVNSRELLSKEYRLLLQTEGRVWLFKSTDRVIGEMSVVTLPQATIRAMTIERATPKGGIS